MTGDALQTQMHLVAAALARAHTRHRYCRCHLEVEKLVAAPYASGLACLVEDEMDLGSLVIDMGAGTTSFAVFFDGNVVYRRRYRHGRRTCHQRYRPRIDDIAGDAERLKTLYGNAIPSPMDEREIVDVPLVGEERRKTPIMFPKRN